MPLLSEQLPNLMNGVSQQTPALRLSSQASHQVNGYSSVVEGVNKRLPTKHVAEVIAGQAGDAYVHTINRDTNERYIVMVFDGSIKVFDMAGNEKPVSYPHGNGYITGIDPNADIRAVTVADHTFILNTSVTVQEDTYRSPAPVSEGMVFIEAVNYDTTYEVEVDGVVVATHTTADAYGTNPKVSIEDVVDDLQTQIKAALSSDYSVVARSPIIYVRRDDGTAMTLEVTDTNGNTMSSVIKDNVQRFTDLPTTAKHGFRVKVSGDEGSAADDYWLQFEVSLGVGFGEGLWVETIAPDTPTDISRITMPHVLVRQSDGSFTFERVDWGQRVVGDEDSSPWPSFVGHKINDIYIDRKRLCFLSDTNVSMSCADDLFNFFRKTVVQLLDDGPINVSAVGSKVSVLQYAVPFNKTVVIFSDQTQFVISDEALLASVPPAVREITAYEIDRGAKPVAVGKSVYFGVRRGNYSSLMEYYVIPETEATDASDVTKHVPTYIPKDMFKLAASTTADVVLMLSRVHPNRIYVYKYYWQQQQKLQSAPSYFELRQGAKILNVDFIGETAFLLVQYPDGVCIESLDFADGVLDDGQDFVTRLDRRVIEDQCIVSYDPAADRTSYTLPYVPTNAVTVVSRPSENAPAYTSLNKANVIGRVVTVFGDQTGVPVYIGEPYTFEYVFSPPTIKTQSQTGGAASVAAGRLQLTSWYIRYANSGYFRVEVTPKNRQTYNYVFSGKTLGTSSAKLGRIELTDGVFSFPVRAKGDSVEIKVINDSFLPCYLTGAEWEGRYERRTSRI